jgi:hypothetical protein
MRIYRCGRQEKSRGLAVRASAAYPQATHRLAGGNQLLDLEAKIVELVGKAAEVVAHAAVAAIAASLDPRTGA